MTTSFLGQSMTQDWNDLMIWEEFFKEHPIKTFIELGSGVGGMSTFLALQCYQRGIEFHTFDNQKFMSWDTGVPALLNLKTRFHFDDMWSTANVATITTLFTQGKHPLAIFMDNGDKRKEWATFAHLAIMGDFLIVHDWGKEFFEKDLLDVPVERIMVNLSDQRPPGSIQAMWFRRK